MLVPCNCCSSSVQCSGDDKFESSAHSCTAALLRCISCNKLSAVPSCQVCSLRHSPSTGASAITILRSDTAQTRCCKSITNSRHAHPTASSEEGEHPLLSQRLQSESNASTDKQEPEMTTGRMFSKQNLAYIPCPRLA